MFFYFCFRQFAPEFVVSVSAIWLGFFVLLWFYVSVLVLILLCMTFLCMKVT